MPPPPSDIVKTASVHGVADFSECLSAASSIKPGIQAQARICQTNYICAKKAIKTWFVKCDGIWRCANNVKKMQKNAWQALMVAASGIRKNVRKK